MGHLQKPASVQLSRDTGEGCASSSQASTTESRLWPRERTSDPRDRRGGQAVGSRLPGSRGRTLNGGWTMEMQAVTARGRRAILGNNTQTHKRLKTLPYSQPTGRDRGSAPWLCSSLGVSRDPPGKCVRWMKGPEEPTQPCASRYRGKWETPQGDQKWEGAGPLHLTARLHPGLPERRPETSLAFQRENLCVSIRPFHTCEQIPQEQEMKRTSYLSKSANTIENSIG